MTFLEAEVAGPGLLRIGPIELTWLDERGLAAGTAVTIGLRPEEIQVRNVNGTTVNRLDTQIVLLDFLGSFCRAQLAPRAVPKMAIVADFSVNLMRDLNIAEGQPLAIALPPESLRVFPKS
jgi:iron(III) transport system ATP-binding protein